MGYICDTSMQMPFRSIHPQSFICNIGQLRTPAIIAKNTNLFHLYLSTIKLGKLQGCVVDIRELKMPNFSTVLTLLVLFSVSAIAAATKKVFSTSSRDDVIIHSSITDDAICKSLVQTQGYVCEEHKVKIHAVFHI